MLRGRREPSFIRFFKFIFARKPQRLPKITIDTEATIFSKKSMSQPFLDASGSPTFAYFVAPLVAFQQAVKNQYRCHAVTDDDWIRPDSNVSSDNTIRDAILSQKIVLRGIIAHGNRQVLMTDVKRAAHGVNRTPPQ